MPIDARKSHEDIVAELIREYKDSGKIGNTEPDDMAHAQKIANAIAYSEKEKGKKKAKVEALEKHIKSLIRPENAAFLEGVVMEGFKACFEGLGTGLDDTPVRKMGRTFFYDTTEGKYYEPSSDMYIQQEDFEALENADREAQQQYVARIQKGIDNTSSPKEMNKLMQAKHLYWDQNSAREAEALAMKLSGDMPMMEADDLESDEIIRMDTDSMTADEIDVVQTQLDELKVEKADVEEKQADIAKKEEALKNSAATFSLNDDTLTEAKSAGASKVLQLMDSDYSYQKALGKVLADNPDLDKATLEKELDTYI